MTRFWADLTAYMVVESVGTWASARWLRGDGRCFMVGAFAAYTACTVLWLLGVAGSQGPSLARALAIYPAVATLTGVAVAVRCGEPLGRSGVLGVALVMAGICALSLRS